MTYTEYKPYVIDTGYLFPPSLADFLGDEDEVHIFREVTEQLDISCVDSDFNGCAVHNVMKEVRHITSLKGKKTALAIICNSRKPVFSEA